VRRTPGTDRGSGPFELAGFAGSEIEEQMHCFAECGGCVEQPETTAYLSVD
jgi:hypothetical protein